MSRSSARRSRRALLLSNATDAAGNELYDMLMSILVVSVLGFTAAEVGLLNALGSISFLLLSVPVGLAVDRWGPAKAIVTSLTLKFAIIAATTILYVAGMLTTVPTFVLVTIIGCATVYSETAQTTIVPTLAADRFEITSLISRMAVMDRIAGIVSPAVAGVLIAASQETLGLAISTVLLIVALIPGIQLLRKPTSRTEPKAPDEPMDPTEPAASSEPATPPVPATRTEEGSTEESFLDMLGHGFRVLGRNRLLLGSTVLIAAGNIGLAMGDTLQSILVLRTLDLGASFFGLMGSIAALSGIAATFIAPAVTKRFSIRTIFVVGAIVQAVVAALPLLSLAVPETAYAAQIGFSALWAITLAITNIAGVSYAADVVDVASLGRTAGARRMITMGGVPIAAVAAGLIADSFGLVLPLAVWPLLTLAAAMIFFIATRDHGPASPRARSGPRV